MTENTNTLDKKIITFIKKHHLLTLATSNNNIPYCASCFYVYDEELNEFAITTDDTTRHGAEMLTNNNVSCCISLETLIVGKIQGLQITATSYKPDEEKNKHFKKLYIKKFPVAAFTNLNLWILKPNFIKMTHNQLGFGKKLIWFRS